jgi:peptidoglycan/xylan/chitin deacetylase (PgdA/CDA1 family)
MDFTHLKELFYNNNEIGSHTHNHYNLDNINYRKIDFELNNSKKILSKFECNTMAYPYGSFNDDVLDVVKKYYMAGRGYYNEKLLNYDYGYNNKNINLYKLKSIPTEIIIPSYDESLLIMEENKFYKTIINIIKYIYENKLWLIFVFHFNRYFLHNIRSYLFNQNKEKKYYDKYMLKNFDLLCQILSNEPKIEINNLKEVIMKYY